MPFLLRPLAPNAPPARLAVHLLPEPGSPGPPLRLHGSCPVRGLWSAPTPRAGCPSVALGRAFLATPCILCPLPPEFSSSEHRHGAAYSLVRLSPPLERRLWEEVWFSAALSAPGVGSGTQETPVNYLLDDQVNEGNGDGTWGLCSQRLARREVNGLPGLEIFSKAKIKILFVSEQHKIYRISKFFGKKFPCQMSSGRTASDYLK